MVDMHKVRREAMRWNILVTLHYNAPYTMPEQRVGEVIQALYPDSTLQELRRELDYLARHDLVTITKQPSGVWFADLDALGVDFVDYTSAAIPGIARPVKYWGA
jgi:hypothetical protein